MKQFKLAASAAVIAALCSSGVFAHVSLKGDAMPVVELPYNWTAYYGGFSIGAVDHNMKVTDVKATSFNSTIEQVSNPKFSVGFQAGYRRQVDLTKASGVFGIEASGQFSNASFKKTYGTPFAAYNLYARNELKNVFLLQLIGGIAADRTLFFLAAGLSWANVTGSWTNLAVGVVPPVPDSFNVNKKAIGTAVGGGIEYACTETLSLRFKADLVTPNAYTTYDGAGNDFLVSNSIVQATFGFNYKFA
jgi:opacity protein-like surface antigen